MVEALNGSQSHAVGVYRIDVLVILAHAEGSTEILSRGADVPNRWVLTCVIPRRNGQVCHQCQDLKLVHWRQVRLHLSTAEDCPRTAARCQLYPCDGAAIPVHGSHEAYPAAGSHRKFICGQRMKVHIGGVGEQEGAAVVGSDNGPVAGRLAVITGGLVE